MCIRDSSEDGAWRGCLRCRVLASHSIATLDQENTMRRLLLLPFVLAGCSAETMTDARPVAPPAIAVLSSGVVAHRVTGSGLQAIAPGFEYALEAVSYTHL